MSKKKLTSYPKEKINILFLENISDVAVDRNQRNKKCTPVGNTQ